MSASVARCARTSAPPLGPSVPERPRRSVARIGDRGFTLIEMMIVIVILGIVVAFAMPSFRKYVAAQAVRAQIGDLVGAIRLSRTEAIKRNRPVTLCRTTDPNAAAPTCAGSGNWADGWLMLAGSEVIRVQQAYNNSGGIEPFGIASLEFLPNGVVLGATGSFRFRPDLPTQDSAYEELSKRLCVAASGVTNPC